MKMMFVRASEYKPTPAIPRAIEAGKDFFDKIVILCWNRNKREVCRDGDNELTVKRFSIVAPPRSLRVLLVTLLYQFWVFWRIIRERPAIIQVLDLESAIPACIARFLVRATLIYDIRDPFADCYKLPRIVRNMAYAVDWMVMGLSSAFIVPSEERLEYLGRWQKSKRPTLVFPNTCYDMIQKIPESVKGLDTGNSYITIAYIGYLDRSRGAMLWADMCRQEKGEIELLVAGECRDSDLASILASSPKMKFLGMLTHPECLAVMKLSDAVALLYDPSAPVNRVADPNKFYEALMVGTPVIVSRGMSLEKIIEEQELGYVVDYNDHDSLKAAVEELKKPHVLEKLRKRCRDYYLNNFQLSNHIVNYSNFYKDCLSN